jgi:hypothetical protein
MARAPERRVEDQRAGRALRGLPEATLAAVVIAVLGDRAAPLLHRLKEWLAQNNAVIMAVVLLLIGAKLFGDGISALS